MKLRYKMICILIMIAVFMGNILTFASEDKGLAATNVVKVSNIVNSEHVLPAGSTAYDLQRAVDNSAPGDIITLSSNITLYSNIGIMVESEKDITIQSTAGNNWTIFQRQDSMFHFYISGNLTLQNITIDGGNTGGLVYVYGGNLVLNDGAIVQNCVSPDVAGGLGIFSGKATMNGNSIVKNCSATLRGGGAYISQSTFVMNDNSMITNCLATSSTNSLGGGVYVYESTFTMNGDSVVTENSSIVRGGGVYINDGTFNMNSGSVTKNSANLGGGIYVHNGEAIIGDGIITENTVTENGGAIYLTNEGNLKVTGNTSITDNNASNGHGGGIYTENGLYENVETGTNTQFNNNISSVDETPPADAQTLYPNIKFASTSIHNHPLNNYDINYSIIYKLEYNANGGTGGCIIPDIEPDSVRAILSIEDVGIERANYTFTEWNTAQDGSGISYNPGDSITINDDVILYAQWYAEGQHVVQFETNGGSTIDNRVVMDGNTVRRPTDPVKTGYIFAGWYTDNRTFENEWDFNTPITEDTILYAKWIITPYFAPCIWILTVMLIIAIAVIIFFKTIWRIIKCIICMIKNWIRYILCRIKKYLKCKCKCNNKCKK